MQTRMISPAPRFSARPAVAGNRSSVQPAPAPVRFSGGGRLYAGGLIGVMIGLIGLFNPARMDRAHDLKTLQTPFTRLQELGKAQQRAGTTPGTFSEEFSDRCRSLLNTMTPKAGSRLGISLYQYTVPYAWQMTPEQSATYQTLCVRAAHAQSIQALKPIYAEALEKVIAPHVSNPQVDLATVRQAGLDFLDEMDGTNPHLGTLFGILAIVSAVALAIGHSKLTFPLVEEYLRQEPQPSLLQLADGKLRRWLEK